MRLRALFLTLTPTAALLAPATQPAAVPRPEPQAALRPEEVAFLDAITCDARDLRQAKNLYEKYGVVRLRKAAANADLLARQATSAGVVAAAFGQKRREDRYTIHLRGDARKWQGDGTDSTDDSAGDGRLEHLAPAVADWLDDDERPWRRVCGDDESVLGRVEIKLQGTPRLDGVKVGN